MDIETFDKANELQKAFGRIENFMEFLRSEPSQRHLKLHGKTEDDIYQLDISIYDEAFIEKLKRQGVVVDEEYHFYKGLGEALIAFLIPRLEQRGADLRAQFEQL